MCPKDFRECWCGFVREPQNYQSYLAQKSPIFLKICSSEPDWINNKDFFVENEFEVLNKIKLPNETIIQSNNELQTSKIIQSLKETRMDENETPQIINTSWESFELNKHDPSLCPNHYSWCWCGVVGDYLSYFKGKKSPEMIGKPQAVVDCRSPQQRVYERRNCSPKPEDSLSWYEKLFNPLASQFPCGHF